MATLLVASSFLVYAQTPSETQSQSEKQTTETPPKQESIVEIAKSTKAKKEKSASTKVYSNEDVLLLPPPGVSTSKPSPNISRPPAKTYVQGEQYWRSRYQYLQQQIDDVDRQIAALNEQIKNSGTVGFDAAGIQRNNTVVQDRTVRLRALEARKKELMKQMDALLDEGRKAGAEPAWFR
ncbi:MAG: hypothetical protein HY046_01620 [Acidobacteria bacterium]|nr:hypothetical protein [Acidobacteriota bacterium]